MRRSKDKNRAVRTVGFFFFPAKPCLVRTDRRTDRRTRALFGAARVGPPFCLGRGRVRGRGGGGGRRKAKGRPVRGFPGWFRPGAPAPAVAGVLDVGAELKSWEPLGYVPEGTPVV